MNYSPVLSFITAAIELGILLIVLITRRRISTSHKTLLAILFFLAGYQLLEALNCSVRFNGMFARAAFVDITWLPPLGLVFITRIIKRQYTRVIAIVYTVIAAAFSIFYGFIDNSVILSQCDTIIAWYRSADPMGLFYGMFYQSGVFLMAVMPFFRKHLDLTKRQAFELSMFQWGVIGFMGPSLITAAIYLPLFRALPSLMCHYAIVLGICIAVILLSAKKSGATTN